MNINTTSINSSTENLYDYFNTLASEYKKIIAQIQELKKGWTSTKATAFYSYFDEKYLVALEKTILDLKKYADYLDKIPTTYSNLDECYSTGIEV